MNFFGVQWTYCVVLMIFFDIFIEVVRIQCLRHVNNQKESQWTFTWASQFLPEHDEPPPLVEDDLRGDILISDFAADFDQAIATCKPHVNQTGHENYTSPNAYWRHNTTLHPNHPLKICGIWPTSVVFDSKSVVFDSNTTS